MNKYKIYIKINIINSIKYLIHCQYCMTKINKLKVI